MQPSDGQTVQDLVKHADQGVFWSAIGWIIGGMATVIGGFLAYFGLRESRRTSTLFKWKDETVDPFMTKVPQVYATKEDIKTYVFTPNREDHERIMDTLEDQGKVLQEMRGMLVERAKK